MVRWPNWAIGPQLTDIVNRMVVLSRSRSCWPRKSKDFLDFGEYIGKPYIWAPLFGPTDKTPYRKITLA